MATNRKRKQNPYADTNTQQQTTATSQKRIKKDVDAIFKKTLSLMREGSKKYAHKTVEEPQQGEEGEACSQCSQLGAKVLCETCSSFLCEHCAQKCEGELHLESITYFCSVCRIINYDKPDERIFCLDCEDYNTKTKQT
eukprot:TRINITY_DN2144_c0_g1_i1.p1 TRINITY_DN2144_c0_g1~~TRINITY_DN2144_c0_g1_i1.p1  ORF type:complete len:139 (-),score=14.45 TRINITY_DN2144_c0_g1_i1:148-564(-)